MPKTLKSTKKAIQTRNRVQLLRGIRSIMTQNSVSQLNVNKLKQTMKNNESASVSNEHTSSSNHCLSDRLSNLSSKLRTWAIEKNINKRAITALLKILRSFGLTSLPEDSRTLLETPRKVDIVELAGGKYWHNGLKNCMTQVFGQLSSNMCVEININFDGLPLFKSSPLNLWPILANVHGTFLITIKTISFTIN